MHVAREVVVNEGTSVQTKQLQCIVDGEYVRRGSNEKYYYVVIDKMVIEITQN